jgi:UDP-glucose 4-epimerase
VRSTYVLSDGSDFSTPEFATALADAAGLRVRLLTVPVPALMVLGRAGDAVKALLGRSFGMDSKTIDRLVGSLPIDARRFRQCFDWHPPISVDIALRRMAGTFSGT